MTYPYSQTLSIPTNGVTVYPSNACLSADIHGNLFLSNGGFGLKGETLNYYGYNINDNIWKTFRHSSYWNHYNYDMEAMACIVHKQVLYTFGGNAGFTDSSEYYGSNMISYHDVSDYNKPFLLNGYSLWQKSSTDLKPFGGHMRAVSVGDLIYIIGGDSWNTKTDGTCCIRGFNDVQMYDPRIDTLKGKIDGVEPLPDTKWYSTTCHFHSTTYTINCFGGANSLVYINKWIYSNVLLTESQTKTPTYVPSNGPSNFPSNIPSKSPTNIPSYIPTYSPFNISNNSSSNTSVLETTFIKQKKIVTIIIVGSMSFILLVILILYIAVTYYKYKHINEPETSEVRIVVRDNPVIIKVESNSKNIKQQFNKNIIKSESDNNVDIQTDELIAKEHQLNELDLHGLTSGKISQNELNTKNGNHVNVDQSKPIHVNTKN